MKSEKPKTKWLTPFWINMFGVILGAILIFIARVYNFLKPSTDMTVLYSAGISFIASTILNILYEYKIGNLLVQTVMRGIYEISTSARYIRHNQSIKFIIKELFQYNGETYLKLDCIHSYTLYNELPIHKKININTFNEFNISRELNELLPPEYKTRFEEVSIMRSNTSDRKETFSQDLSEDKKYFDFDSYGYPSFVKSDVEIGGRKITSLSWMKVEYKISNTHYLRSNHSWYFQELSDGLELIIENRIGCSNSCFSLIMNHPNREEIESCNADFINTTGQLRNGKKTSKVSTNFVFLPYQGFSLQWDLEEYAKSSKEKNVRVGLTDNVN
jgi:hypothetical protein